MARRGIYGMFVLFYLASIAASTTEAKTHHAPEERPGRVDLSSIDFEHIGNGVQFKIRHRSQRRRVKGEEDEYVRISQIVDSVSEVVSHLTVGGIKPHRVFRDAGVHEQDHIDAGLHLWYRFDVDGTKSHENDEFAAQRRVVKAVELLHKATSTGDKHGARFEKGHVLASALSSVGAEFKTRQMYLTNDPQLGLQREEHYDVVNLPEAWDLTMGSPDTVVQVIDSGIDMDHPDLQNNKWSNVDEICGNGIDDDGNGFVDDCQGYNHADSSGTILDGSGSHGTHCAGTIAADSDNGVGVAGVAGGKGASQPGASLMINTCFGQYYTGGFAEALVYGGDNGAHISSNSWGYTSPGVYDLAVLEAIDYAVDKDVIVVFAAGNGYTDEDWYPAYYDKTIAVAALQKTKVVAAFTNYGAWVDISAPGNPVLSTVMVESGSYDWYSGTSMACPHIAGGLALAKSYKPSATSTELKDCLFSTAENVDSYNAAKYAGGLGAGLMDIYEMLMCLGPQPTALPTSTPNPSSVPTPMPSMPTPVPTPLPTRMPVSCNVCDHTLELRITTDTWPSETSYTLESSDETCFADVTGPSFSLGSSSTYTFYVSEELCDGFEYTFTMLDDYCDGICCGYGYGSYALSLDGVVIVTSSGDYGCSETSTFLVEARQPTLSPSPEPSAPTNTPIPSPTHSPIVCGGCSHTLDLVITTDLYPWETTYSFKATDGFEDCFVDEVLGPDVEWAKSTTYTVQLADSLCENVKYSFTLSDTWGDGICCTDGPGTYQLLVDGSTIYTSDGDFQDSDVYTFRIGSTPVSSPVSPPSDGTLSVSSCDDLGWTNAEKYGSSMICGESDYGLGSGVCSGNLNWGDAVEYCENSGARLCTASELENDEAAGTGCSHDKHMVWSSTSCGTGSYITTSGSTLVDESDCFDASTRVPVRCCADVLRVPYPLPVSTPVSPPSAISPFSASTCDELGWGNAEEWGDSMVCGESDDSLGGCSGDLSWTQAVDFCEGAGARLCTFDELRNDEAGGTGCSGDKHMTWSSTSCDAGSYIQEHGSSIGGTGDSECVAATHSTRVRCCADVAQYNVWLPSVSSCSDLGWNSAEYGSTTTCGESDLGLGGCSGKLSWAGAVDYCESAGTRLCTQDELQNDEARDTGCSLDDEMVWTSIPCGSGRYVKAGGSSEVTDSECSAASSETYARCCADESIVLGIKKQ